MKKIAYGIGLIAAIAAVYWWGHSDGSAGKSLPSLVGSAHAQDSPAGEAGAKVSPVAARERDVYYPQQRNFET